MVLKSSHHAVRQAGWLVPAQVTALQAKLIAKPVPKVGAPHAQGWDPDLQGDAVEIGLAGFAGEQHPASKRLGITPRHRDQCLAQGWIDLVESIDQDSAVPQVRQQRHALALKILVAEAQQQSSSAIGAVVDQSRQVVFAQPWFSADQHRTMRRIGSGVANRAPKTSGVAAVPDDTAPDSPHHVRPKLQELLVRLSQCRFRPG